MHTFLIDQINRKRPTNSPTLFNYKDGELKFMLQIQLLQSFAEEKAIHITAIQYQSKVSLLFELIKEIEPYNIAILVECPQNNNLQQSLLQNGFNQYPFFPNNYIKKNHIQKYRFHKY
jgi:hypothetical protein